MPIGREAGVERGVTGRKHRIARGRAGFSGEQRGFRALAGGERVVSCDRNGRVKENTASRLTYHEVMI